MNLAEFERRYRAEPDPWNYRSSVYERAKYDATLVACGSGPFRSALELGGSIGVFSARLAPRCLSLTTLDGSPTAVRAAREMLVPHPQAQALVAEIPAQIPAGSYDLVVASEILYYLDAAALEATVAAVEASLAPGGRLIAVHWRPAGPERPHTAAEVHDRLCALSWLHVLHNGSTPDYLLHALERA
jgi:SAM-dependent methyltransferase